MTKTKNTKHLIITTSLALILCLATLFGTTFAWFTSSVTTAENTVKSASFNVVLEYSTDMNTWTTLSNSSVLFADSDAALTPGQNTGVKYIRVTNNNTYAVKASVSIGTVTTSSGTTEMQLRKKAGVTTATAVADLDAGVALAATNIINNQQIAAGGNYIVAVAIELPTTAENPGVVDTFTITIGATQQA